MPLDPYARRLLLKVRDEVLTGPERWTQGESARDATGASVGWNSDRAVCWCLSGAIARVQGRCSTFGPADRILDDLCSDSGTDYVDWNDAPDRVYADVRSLLDRALGEGA